MPHCIIEHSPNIPPEGLLQAVFNGALHSQLFLPDGADIKVRAIAYQNFKLGDGKASFVHVVVKILAGRTDEQKQRLSQQIIKKLSGLGHQDISITVEVVDMERQSYQKHLA